MIQNGFICIHAVGPWLLTSVYIDIFYNSDLHMLQNTRCKLKHITLHLALERVCLLWKAQAVCECTLHVCGVHIYTLSRFLNNNNNNKSPSSVFSGFFAEWSLWHLNWVETYLKYKMLLLEMERFMWQVLILIVNDVAATLSSHDPL